ncbi:MAG: type II toxin-antitoxin system RelE/ParE family toxin [Vicinamibacteraceae bacterium]
MTYHLSALAEEDLRDAWRYIADEAGEARADQVLAEIFDGVLMLTRQPRVGRLRAEFGAGIRCLPVRRYLVYYREEDASVLIARVLHARRDQSAAWQA